MSRQTSHKASDNKTSLIRLLLIIYNKKSFPTNRIPVVVQHPLVPEGDVPVCVDIDQYDFHDLMRCHAIVDFQIPGTFQFFISSKSQRLVSPYQQFEILEKRCPGIIGCATKAFVEGNLPKTDDPSLLNEVMNTGIKVTAPMKYFEYITKTKFVFTKTEFSPIYEDRRFKHVPKVQKTNLLTFTVAPRHCLDCNASHSINISKSALEDLEKKHNIRSGIFKPITGFSCTFSEVTNDSKEKEKREQVMKDIFLKPCYRQEEFVVNNVPNLNMIVVDKDKFGPIPGTALFCSALIIFAAYISGKGSSRNKVRKDLNSAFLDVTFTEDDAKEYRTVMTRLMNSFKLVSRKEEDAPSVKHKAEKFLLAPPPVSNVWGRFQPSTLSLSQDTSSDSHLTCPQEKALCFEENPSCSQEKVLCAEENPLCSQEKALCSQEEPLCPEENSSCSQEEPLCPEEELSCPGQDSSCPEENPSCPGQDSSCSQEEPLCFQENPSCPGQDSSCPYHNASCSQEKPLCSQENPLCFQEKVSGPDPHVTCLHMNVPCHHQDFPCPEEEPSCSQENLSCPGQDPSYSQENLSCPGQDSSCSQEQVSPPVQHVQPEENQKTVDPNTLQAPRYSEALDSFGATRTLDIHDTTQYPDLTRSTSLKKKKRRNKSGEASSPLHVPGNISGATRNMSGTDTHMSPPAGKIFLLTRDTSGATGIRSDVTRNTYGTDGHMSDVTNNMCGTDGHMSLPDLHMSGTDDHMSDVTNNMCGTDDHMSLPDLHMSPSAGKICVATRDISVETCPVSSSNRSKKDSLPSANKKPGNNKDVPAKTDKPRKSKKEKTGAQSNAPGLVQQQTHVPNESLPTGRTSSSAHISQHLPMYQQMCMHQQVSFPQQGFATYPQTFAAYPQTFTTYPQTFATYPQTFTTHQQMSSHDQQMFNTSPQETSRLLSETSGLLPQTSGLLPQAPPYVPQGSSYLPHMFTSSYPMMNQLYQSQGNQVTVNVLSNGRVFYVSLPYNPNPQCVVFTIPGLPSHVETKRETFYDSQLSADGLLSSAEENNLFSSDDTKRETPEEFPADPKEDSSEEKTCQVSSPRSQACATENQSCVNTCKLQTPVSSPRSQACATDPQSCVNTCQIRTPVSSPESQACATDPQSCVNTCKPQTPVNTCVSQGCATENQSCVASPKSQACATDSQSCVASPKSQACATDPQSCVNTCRFQTPVSSPRSQACATDNQSCVNTCQIKTPVSSPRSQACATDNQSCVASPRSQACATDNQSCVNMCQIKTPVASPKNQHVETCHMSQACATDPPSCVSSPQKHNTCKNNIDDLIQIFSPVDMPQLFVKTKKGKKKQAKPQNDSLKSKKEWDETVTDCKKNVFGNTMGPSCDM